MISKKELQLAKWSIVILLVVGILGYIFTAYTTKAPDEPVKKIYDAAKGKVIFDHKTHTLETKYGLSCTDCHHHPQDEEEAIRSCDYCHVYPDKNKPFNSNCLDCHDQEDIEGVKTNNQVDSTHSRGECIKCHTEYGKGPVECESCHAKIY
jgi:hypothetical protein